MMEVETKEESPSKRMKMSNSNFAGSEGRRRKMRKAGDGRSIESTVATSSQTVTLPAGILRGNAVFELASAALSNILFMRQVIAYPTMQQLAASLDMDSDVAASGALSNALILRRKRKSTHKSLRSLLNAVEEFKSLCQSQEIKTFGVFFGPSHSVPKAVYTFDFPVASLNSSSDDADIIECKIDSAIRVLVRSLVMFWSDCGTVTAAPNTNIFIGAKPNGFRFSSSTSDDRMMRSLPNTFVYKEQYDELITRKKKVSRFHFQLRSKQLHNTGLQQTTSVTEIQSEDTEGHWILLKKPLKVSKM